MFYYRLIFKNQILKNELKKSVIFDYFTFTANNDYFICK